MIKSGGLEASMTPSGNNSVACPSPLRQAASAESCAAEAGPASQLDQSREQPASLTPQADGRREVIQSPYTGRTEIPGSMVSPAGRLYEDVFPTAEGSKRRSVGRKLDLGLGPILEED
mmetsp:Transcript_23691/g.61890  ORF Transcript_23691/g.61890 Transcript_23691/m.61890 type:complete len:118 (+) Transcript_23691:173-526(+)